MKKVLLIFLLVSIFARGQEANRFANEIEAIQKKYDTLLDTSKETTVFAGSSSVRIWHDLQEKFPKHQIVNAGFGGSQASDLLAYTDELILQYKPKKVFIYEGDNDISAGKDVKVILSDISQIISKIREQNQSVKIVLIAAKPSIARWNLKRDYKRLNRKFKKMSRKDADILFVDVWKPMLNGRKVKQDIFIEDGLHMNAKGYAIWYNAIKSFLE
ncbi:G-D-S-L family lipolytic protein [Maribacter algarum]|uniref:G-D-S-L family lipolytic protein n=1 Tax=Maribacter algarum (ex Zhang et al. 2020) TaxID=2578118 RepID=A0A5S3PGQ2_9FLAO|nr:GDSL-type esterase/lipase family protein [Maribacter algarum]TMM53285.1 G-D-S-L family lipolytic protein [Maribacter algarum]